MNQNSPNDHLDKIRYAVNAGLYLQNFELLHLINGGYSGAYVYSISVNNQTYVVKLNNTLDHHNDPAHYYPHLQNASESKIAPRVYFSDASRGVILMEHIKCKPLPIANDESIAAYARHIQNLHQLERFSKRKSLEEMLQTFLEKLPQTYHQSRIIQSAVCLGQKISALLNDTQDERSTHSDLNPSNVLFNGRQYYLVDWQASAKRNLYFDLACCAIFFYYHDSRLQDKFLHDYFNREPTSDEQEKYQLMQVFVNIYYGLIFLALPFMNNESLQPFSDQQIIDLPAFDSFMQLVGAGYINIGQHKTQQQFGYIFLNKALDIISSNQHCAALKVI